MTFKRAASRGRAPTGRGVRRAWLAPAALLALATTGACAHAERYGVAGRVLWVRDGAIYVAAPDSGSLGTGMTLEFSRDGRTLATAKVSRMLDAHVALARLESGSLSHERRLDELAIRAEAAPVERAGRVRLGLPGRERVSLLFRCVRTGVDTRLGSATYDPDPRGTHAERGSGGLRLLRRPSETPADGPAPTAPDTLDVRFFSDAADQEIALERGELDVAVFWPGELSARMRGDPRWKDFARGLRARGVLAAVRAARDTLPWDPRPLAALEREAFAGDLLPWRELEPAPEPTAAPRPLRWQVDPALPGARILERILQRAGNPAVQRTARLTWLDVPVAARDAVQGTWRTPGVEPLHALRCPVLVAPALRPSFAAMGGADAFANLLRCESGAP